MSDKPLGNQPAPEVVISNSGATDQPTGNDQLGFSPYVTALAEFLTNESTKPPLAISIEGEWGCGKSSFMKQLQAALAKGGKLSPNAIIWFNAWRHDKVDSLWATFAVQFAEELRGKLSYLDQLKADVRLCYERYNKKEGLWDFLRVIFLWVVYLGCALTILFLIYLHGAEWFEDHHYIQLFGSVAVGLSLLVSTFKKLKDVVGSPLDIDLKKYIESPDYKSRIGFIESFHEDLTKIIKVYGRGKIIIFIDDLDRCEIPNAADLIQGLNLMISDDPQLIFIVGMDREKVAAALASKYQELLPYLSQLGFPPGEASAREPAFGIEFGFSFVEKFIQIPFRVPQPKLDIERFFERMTKSSPQNQPEDPVRNDIENEIVRIVTGDDSPIVPKIGKILAPTLDYNPRRLKQFLNLFRLKTIIAGNTGLFQGQHGVTLEQLAKWVVIILRWPLLLNDLDSTPGLLAELQRLAIDPSAPPTDPPDNIATAALKRWQSRPNLMKFLRVGCTPENSQQDRLNWNMELVDVSRLLQVSPLFKHRNPDRGAAGGFPKEEMEAKPRVFDAEVKEAAEATDRSEAQVARPSVEYV